ncbi:MAG: SIMPL domain-containing protein [Candidatus Omnitrophica bacterium]|nr:SIMPL domain-containing protein [Candidatus Omnitrophota bacterium]MDD5351728.1 SIMPL domain-containing protein [Candidatus Omnitrophota bacterium]MDD5550938.1 SIMPL domain-containing protein [Candidatus Omnitrophota bacterium]
MEGGRMLRNSQIIVLGICIAAATIVSSIILSQGFLKVTKFVKEQIIVTGSAQKNIRSDYIVWRGIFSIRQADLKSAYQKLGEDLVKVKKYLIDKRVDEKEIIVSQIVTNKIYKKNEKGNDTNEIQWYALSQTVELCSNDVDKVDKISRESTELINDNVEFESQAPEYFYTKLDELKIEMLAKASENAKQRAESMVKATGNKIGFMRSARMGVFQITPINSTEVSDWGVNDTTSIEKKVTAVVSASFAIE